MREPDAQIAFADDELIVDSFAGGGGASVGIEWALGRHVDIAINHDPEALAMHRVNHPLTQHVCENVWRADIVGLVAGRKVGLAWFSPDCKHFSKAKGGKPVSRKIRGLAWVAIRWAKLVRPRVIILENVEEFTSWGPLDDQGRPCELRKGATFQRWVAQLRNLGYRVEWRELRACAYGAPTIRRRLFLVARRDGEAIAWPGATHGAGLLPLRSAAECIDWSIPCPSIFASVGEAKSLRIIRPLAEKTLRRIAHGVFRYVINSARPFIVNITHTGGHRTESLDAPLRTITGAKRGEKALIIPSLMQYYGTNESGCERGAAINEPLRTQPTENRHALVTAFLAQHNTGVVGRPADAPLSTITQRGTQQAVVTAAFVSRQFGRSIGRDAELPMGTVTAGGGGKSALVASSIVKLRGTSSDGHALCEPLHTISAQGTHLAEVRAFLIKYYGADQDPQLGEPLHTITTRDRFGLVTVDGDDYQIVDIGMRMLTPRELFRAQGFPETYIIDRGIRITDHGESCDLFAVDIALPKTAQIRMCGNSVSPWPAQAIVAAQFSIGQREEVA